MAVPKNTQTRFVGITYHIHYTSLRLLFSSTSDSIKCRCILILIHGYTVLIFHSCKHVPHIIICVCTAAQKASVGIYSGCDTLSLRILFVYFLALPSLLHPSILFNCFLYLYKISLKQPEFSSSHTCCRLWAWSYISACAPKQ